MRALRGADLGMLRGTLRAQPPLTGDHAQTPRRAVLERSALDAMTPRVAARALRHRAVIVREALRDAGAEPRIADLSRAVAGAIAGALTGPITKNAAGDSAGIGATVPPLALLAEQHQRLVTTGADEQQRGGHPPHRPSPAGRPPAAHRTHNLADGRR